MKIEILGRRIEIDDAKVLEIFENKLADNTSLSIDKEQFVQRVLDYFELNLENKIISALETKLSLALSTMKDIASYKYTEKVSPFLKPWNIMKPNDLPYRELSNHDRKFLEKMGLTDERDEELIQEKYKEEEERRKNYYK